MTAIYEELNWPKVPEEFCITDEEFMINNFIHSHPVDHYLYYRQYKYNNNTLVKFLQPLFDFNIEGRIFYQIIKKVFLHTKMLVEKLSIIIFSIPEEIMFILDSTKKIK